MCEPIKTNGKQPQDIHEYEKCLVFYDNSWCMAYVLPYYGSTCWKLLERYKYVSFDGIEWCAKLPQDPREI